MTRFPKYSFSDNSKRIIFRYSKLLSNNHQVSVSKNDNCFFFFLPLQGPSLSRPTAIVSQYYFASCRELTRAGGLISIDTQIPWGGRNAGRETIWSSPPHPRKYRDNLKKNRKRNSNVLNVYNPRGFGGRERILLGRRILRFARLHPIVQNAIAPRHAGSLFVTVPIHTCAANKVSQSNVKHVQVCNNYQEDSGGVQRVYIYIYVHS